MVGAHSVLALETSTPLLFHPYLLFSLVLPPWEAPALGLEKDKVARVQHAPVPAHPAAAPPPCLSSPAQITALAWPLRVCGGF